MQKRYGTTTRGRKLNQRSNCCKGQDSFRSSTREVYNLAAAFWADAKENMFPGFAARHSEPCTTNTKSLRDSGRRGGLFLERARAALLLCGESGALPPEKDARFIDRRKRTPLLRELPFSPPPFAPVSSVTCFSRAFVQDGRRQQV